VADAATGLCHHRFRVYDPETARFVSPDPLEVVGGDNTFGYPTDLIYRASQGQAGHPRDVERQLGIKRGRGNHYVELDARPGEFEVVNNPLTGAREFVFDGDVDLTNRNPTFYRNH